jgi:hypothetical protein
LVCLALFFGADAIRSAGQSNDEDDQRLRELFLKNRQQIEVVPSPSPGAKATPAPAPRPVRKPFRTPPDNEETRSPAPPGKPAPRGGPKPEATAGPAAAGTATASPGQSGPGAPAPDLEEEAEEMAEEPTPTVTPPPPPTATPVPTPTPKRRRRWFFFGPWEDVHEPKITPQMKNGQAPIVIEKSGAQAGQELAPVPGYGFYRWRYLTSAIRRAIDDARVARGRWKYIVVHNSGTRQGSARIFDYYHRHVRRMPNGLAYHFVIGNGSSSGNGQIEIGNRWIRQLPGGHVHSDYLNYIGIGICLVGDFNRDLPTQAQYEALDELIRYLRQRVGKVDGQSTIVLGHREINPRPTDCPGSRFPLNWLHHTFPNN